ncbi:MAG: hypothetical protein M1838_003227 [Thelocarpon superellum]|nr:MAG: hypothetical protein M1838_003227 [Thelocarpon superellum]
MSRSKAPSAHPPPTCTVAAESPSSSRTPSPSRSSRSSLDRRRSQRPSFSSVKEDDSGVAQSFVESRESSFYPLTRSVTHDDVARGDADPATVATTLAIQSPSFCFPCGCFKEWKGIKLRGTGLSKSKSSSDLRLLTGHDRRSWDATAASTPRAPEKIAPAERALYAPGKSPLERLPIEILDEILPRLVLDVPPQGYSHRNIDLISCLLTSRTLHAVTLMTLYRNITLPHSIIFSKFLTHIADHPALGTVVRRLDFSHFSSVGLGRTRRMNSELQMVTAATLLACLQLTPRLREFLVQEHLDDDLDELVLTKLFCDLPNLQAVDFCAASSSAFKNAMSTVLSRSNARLSATMPLRRVSFHECTTLPAAVFETLLARLPGLTHLDVGHTQMTDTALFAISPHARLTHLNLSRCTWLTGPRVVDFLTTHPAATTSLVYLNLQAEIARHRLLAQEDVERLLPRLPAPLRALNVSGAKIVSAHLGLILPLTKNLDELSLGFAELSIDDLNRLFTPATATATMADDRSGVLSKEEREWVAPALRYLDLTGVPALTPGKMLSTSCLLLRPYTQPLEVLELGEKVIAGLRDRPASSRRLGWVLKEFGRRGWLVREPSSDASLPRDNSRRAWKMGAKGWGMRKIPVTSGEVGGLYGHYMFKK